MIDDELREDLRKIDSEVQRRKSAKPFEPYAVWAMNERMAAIQRSMQRDIAKQSVTRP